MKKTNILKIKNRRKFLKELELSKKQNFENNMKFVRFHAQWIKRTGNKEWSKQQKFLIDEIYRSNRHFRLKAS